MTVSIGSMNVVVNEIVNGTTTGPTIDCYGLHANGYTTFGDRLHRVFPYTHRHSLSFTRRRHSTIRIGDATHILIPTPMKLTRDVTILSKSLQYTLRMRLSMLLI